MSISTIISDLGGVVLNNDWHDGNKEKFNEYSRIFGIRYEDMERGWNRAWPDYMLGKITENEFWSIFLESAGANSVDVSTAKQLWRKHVVENESMLSLLTNLKKRYTLGALTTISREWLDYKIVKFGLDSLFTAIVSSGYYGVAKPDPLIYQIIIEELGVEPSSCLFIDDSPETLPPAKDLGMRTLLFTTQKELEGKLSSFGIKYDHLPYPSNIVRKSVVSPIRLSVFHQMKYNL